MGIMPDSSPFGSQTVTGPGWPNVDEESLSSAAAQYEALAAKLTGSVIPQQQSQLTKMSSDWGGGASVAAAGEATTIIGGHESNAAQATAIALKLRSMEVTVAKTKALVNTTAVETQQECMLILAASAMSGGTTQQLIDSRIKLGLSQNIAYVTANSAELAGGLGVPPSIPNPGAPPTAAAQQAGQQGSQQAMQMLSQMGQMAGQLGGMLTQAPQQLMQPLQQLAQPLQQLTSMFGSGGKGGSAGSASPFSSFSNHPLAGGSGAGGGAGLVKAASLPGSGGVGAQTPLMASLVGSQPAGVAVAAPTASSAAVGGVAPVAAGGGGMGGGMGMMGGARGEGGGTGSSLAVPAPLDYGADEDVDDDW